MKNDRRERIGNDLSEYQKWVDYDMRKYGRISDITKGKIRRAGLSIVKDQYGDYEVIADRPIKERLKEGKEGRYSLEIWVPGSGGDDDRERTLLVSDDINKIIKKAYDTTLDRDEAFYLADWKGVYEPDLDQCYSAEQLEDDIYSIWKYDPDKDLSRFLGKKLLPQKKYNESCKRRSCRKVKEGYELLSGTQVEAYKDYYRAKARAEELGLKEAEYGNTRRISYCYWNKSGNRNEDEEVIAYYSFDGIKVRPLTDEEADYIEYKFDIKFDDRDIDESCRRRNEACKSRRGRKLTEKHWRYRLKKSGELRDAVDDGDLDGVLAMLQMCYQELADREIIDQDDCDKYVEELDNIDTNEDDYEFTGYHYDDDDEEDEEDEYVDARSEVQFAINNFFELCDNLGVFVEI